MADMFKNGVLHFDYKAEELAPAEAAARVQLEKDLAALVALPKEQRTFENTIMAYERAFDDYGKALGMSGFLSYVSTDKNFRDAALALQMQISQYMVDVATRRDVYRAIREYTDTNPQLDPVQAKLVKEMLIGFKNSGMELSDEDLEKFKALNKQKAEYIIKFDKNIQEYKDPLAVTRDQLTGLGDDYIEKLEKNLAGIDSVTACLDRGDTPEQLLEKLLEGLELEFQEKTGLQFFCNCSRERVEKAVVSIGKKEIAEMIQEGKPVEVKCHFCNKAYEFSMEDLKRIIKRSR